MISVQPVAGPAWVFVKFFQVVVGAQSSCPGL
jgi:hypothetical protein